MIHCGSGGGLGLGMQALEWTLDAALDRAMEFAGAYELPVDRATLATELSYVCEKTYETAVVIQELDLPNPKAQGE